MELLSVGQMVHAIAGFLPGPEPEREAAEILAAVLDVSRSWPSLHADEKLSEEQTADVLFAARMRERGMPIQYAVGKAPFRHLTLAVDERVLIPRPETESLVDLVMRRAPRGVIADICTGSGAIAIALATEGGYDRVVATDLSSGALEVARENAARYAKDLRAQIEFRDGNLLEPLGAEIFDAVVSNPPYIAEEEMEGLPSEVRDWEPHQALASGADGLDALRGIIGAAAGSLKVGGLLAVEVDSRRAERTADIFRAEDSYEKIEITPDLTGRPRFVSALRR